MEPHPDSIEGNDGIDNFSWPHVRLANRHSVLSSHAKASRSFLSRSFTRSDSDSHKWESPEHVSLGSFFCCAGTRLRKRCKSVAK